MEKSLFTSQALARLADSENAQVAFKVLVELGFGAGAAVKDGDFDALFSAEEKSIAAFLKEFNVDGALDAFLALNDYLNLKSIFKSVKSGKPAVLSENGLYDADDIKAWFSQDKASDIPEPFREIVLKLKELPSDASLERKIDCTVDKATYAHIFILTKKQKELRKYFVKSADYANLFAYLRAKRLGLSKKQFEEGFISGGELDFLPEIFDEPLEKLKERCKFTSYGDFVGRAVDGAPLAELEAERDNELFKSFKENDNELFGISPIVAFYLAKQTQIRVAKLIVAGIKNGVDSAKIKERMRELYA